MDSLKVKIEDKSRLRKLKKTEDEVKIGGKILINSEFKLFTIKN